MCINLNCWIYTTTLLLTHRCEPSYTQRNKHGSLHYTKAGQTHLIGGWASFPSKASLAILHPILGTADVGKMEQVQRRATKRARGSGNPSLTQNSEENFVCWVWGREAKERGFIIIILKYLKGCVIWKEERPYFLRLLRAVREPWVVLYWKFLISIRAATSQECCDNCLC